MNNLDKDIKILEEMQEDGLNVVKCYKMTQNYYKAKKVKQKVQAISNVLSELETYKKIAEKLAEEMMKLPEGNYYYDSKEGWLDWARNEVENG